MANSTFPRTSNRSRIAFAAGVLTIAAAAAFVFTHQPARVAPSAPALVPVTAALAKPAGIQKQDLGAGYTLQTDASGTHIVAPVTVVRSASSQTLDLGAGYMLKDGLIIAPERPAIVYQRQDLGAGYTLYLTSEGGQIVAPETNYRPAPASVQKIDLGAGYTLTTDTDGTRIVAPEVKVLAQPAPLQKIDLKGGYWLIDGKIIH